ncbi:stage V sporulation protein AA [Oikeobacillus pervagus]|uniref:Stage V sporulation protein AA n=1 Tax=Oikeobacillus pervagus TaxID=1325931 RepID=A0AAJ1WFB6_9BACI|nr:stage V sporulation protein AA [Oikeobacillus pervagus]MDQ0213752.1 stage V sporulation protein AA [Oikeobacillus pervagus]
MEASVHLRMRHRVQMRPNGKVFLKDLAQIVAPDRYLKKLQNIFIYEIQPEDHNIIVIDAIRVLKAITDTLPQIDIQLVGPSQTIIEIIYQKKKVSVPFFILVWFTLFIGAGLTIMNFHEDVSMQKVQIQLYEMMTGEKNIRPLIFQIPYSIGLGLGMILFFNHVFKKRINEEPSPLEVEMFNYQQDLDHYVVMNENKESMKTLHDN